MAQNLPRAQIGANVVVSNLTARTDVETRGTRAARPSRFAIALTTSGFIMLAAAGLLLWARHSESIFANFLISAIASCF